MNENQIIEQLTLLSKKLDEGEVRIKENKWEEVVQLFSQAGKIQATIQKNEPPVDILCSRNPSFNASYSTLKTTLLEKTQRIIETIEKWKTIQVEKISNSKNTLATISRFYSPTTSSYYFDRQE